MNKATELRLRAIDMGKKLGYAGGLVLAASSAHAAIDTASITAVITDVVTAAGVVGAAVLAMHYGIKAYKWLKSAG